MPIRDVEWFGDPGMQCRVVANRGVNGIDGLVSTALGLAAGGGQTVALLGDLAFLHDSGGLTGAGARAADCTFVVIDNGGGGIFNFLPQAGLPADVFERFWGTPHGVDLALLAAAHGLPCETVESAGALSAAVRRVEGVRVLLVRTDRAENVVIHDRLNAAVQAAVDAALRA
jgi:2-succinyl-5-enolpyruvyl-6-hydroxy-3-cyclohexene-1-carboxylate synthase